MKPNMKVVELRSRSKLLTVSNLYIEIKEEEYEDDMIDL